MASQTATRSNLFACAPSTSRGQSVPLSADPKNERFLYTNGRTVIIRDLANPSWASEYTEHTCQASVAVWSPSGYYVASGDVQGNVRVWDATQLGQHSLKSTSRPVSGRVNDISWDSESKRLIAVGDGRERFGHAFTFDTGNSCGEILGHSKVVNSCSIRSVRPFRAATGGDDLTVNFYHGPPFKFVKSITDHSRFVQSVRFSPDGQLLVTAGLDAKLFMYDGGSGDKVGEILDGHTGGIFAVSWSADSSKFMTSSADMTVKVWDASTKQAINTYRLGDGSNVNDQQVGNLWAGSHLLSLSLGGEFNYFDLRSEKPVKVVHGHQKAITAFETVHGSDCFFSGSYDGRIYEWDLAGDCLAKAVSGSGHTNQVSSISQQSPSNVVSIGLDDTVRSINLKSHSFSETVLSTDSQPQALASSAKLSVSVVATVKQLVVIDSGNNKLAALDIKYTVLSLAISPDGTELAVGSEDQKVYLYSLAATTGELQKKPQELTYNRGMITALAYSPNGKLLAAGDSDRKIMVYETGTGELKFNEWVFHSARVNCIAWSQDSVYAVSGGLDRDIYVWNTVKPMKFCVIKGAHQDGVTGVAFSKDGKQVISTGQDACVKVWTINEFPGSSK